MQRRRTLALALVPMLALHACLPTSDGQRDDDVVPIEEEDAGSVDQDTGSVEEDAGSGEVDMGADEVDQGRDDPPEDAIGDACASDTDCSDGVCLLDRIFEGGHCSQACDDTCPGDASCLGGFCFAACSPDGSCRDGYDCIDGDVCLPSPKPIDVPVGAACASDAECGDGGTCVTDYPGGYCIGSCNALELCPQGSECVDLGDEVEICIDTCSRDSDCREGYQCSPQDHCLPVPTSDDVFQSFTLHHPCSSSLWGNWTNGEDFDLGEIQLLDAAGDLVSTRTFFNTQEFWSGRAEHYELFENVSLDLQQTYTVRFKLRDGRTFDQQASLTNDLPPKTDVVEVRSVDTTGGELELTLRPSFGGTLYRASIYDTTHCFEARKTYTTGAFLTKGSPSRVTFSGTFAPATTFQLVLEGRNDETRYSFYDVVEFTTP